MDKHLNELQTIFNGLNELEVKGNSVDILFVIKTRLANLIAGMKGQGRQDPECSKKD